MTGKNSLHEIFAKQIKFQQLVTGEAHLPQDNIEWASYHVLGLVEEVGEVLKADKRWKTHRNSHYDKRNKLEELADIFITSTNIALFSGFSADDIYKATLEKIEVNTSKLELERSKTNNATNNS